MRLLIIFLPLFSFLVTATAGRFLRRLGAAYFTIFLMIQTLLICIFSIYEIIFSNITVSYTLWNWIIIDCYLIDFGFLFDFLSMWMSFLIVFISTLVHIYSFSYMSHDPFLPRFMAYLSLFTFFMLLLVTSSNFLQMFIGWEGVGVCSYLLINFWFTRIAANKAALKAMIMNRIADVFFIIAIIFILNIFKTTDYLIVFNLIPFILSDNIIFMNMALSKISIICFFLFIGAIGKSAQIGFHTWLPDAMEGPTPVSSLLHAATMVTAGVFLVIRCSIIFEYNEWILFLLIIFGGITALIAGCIAVTVYDVKKVIAYSTTSQLGYMFICNGLSLYNITFFHLFNHAFFKALLFLSAGALIHALFDEQDMRRMGGFVSILPFTYTCFLLGSLAIAGFPFLTGFYSKDLILEFAYNRFVVDSLFIYCLSLTSAIFTASYSIRLIYLVFIPRVTNAYFVYLKSFEDSSKEVDLYMFIPMFILGLASIFVGFLCSELFVGLGNFYWKNSICILPIHFGFIETEFIHPIIKNLPVIFTFLFIFIMWVFLELFNKNYILRFNTFFKDIMAFGYHAGFFNVLYNNLFIILYNTSYSYNNKLLDKGFFEYFGPFGIYKFFYNLKNLFPYAYPFLITISLFMMFLSIIIFLFIFSSAFSNIFLVLIKELGLLPVIILTLFRTTK